MDTNRSIEVGNLIFEDFCGLSGWDIEKQGGQINIHRAVYGELAASGEDAGIAIKKRFLPQSEKTVTLEFRCWFDRRQDGVFWELVNDSTLVLGLVTVGNQICWQNANGKIHPLAPYAAKTWYGVKMVVALGSKTADIYMDGQQKATAVPLLVPDRAARLNALRLGTPDSAEVQLRLAYIRLYTGYLVNESFLSTKLGACPSDWLLDAGSGTAEVAVVPHSNLLFDEMPEENYSLKLETDGQARPISCSKSLSPQTGSLVYEFKFMMPNDPGKMDGFTAEICGSGNSALKIFTTKSDIFTYDSTGSAIPILKNYKANIWYHVKAAVNSVAGRRSAEIYINSVRKTDSAIVLSKVSDSLDEIRFSLSSDAPGVVWLDEIKVYPPIIYNVVPAPHMVDTGDYLVGVQVCSLWKEGTGAGWDSVNKPEFQDRKPVLGWYDEQNPEVTDWEIKYAVEHGITFFDYCWYRNSVDAPIQNPTMGHGIHEGFFNARYRDLMKFTIMWIHGEFEGVSGPEDMLENVLPFFIEHYFKHPSFLKIDGKPVLVMYHPEGLKQNLGGSNAAVRNLFEAMREACKAEGFPGLIIWAVAYTDGLKDLLASGYDGIYPYVIVEEGNPDGLTSMSDEEAMKLQRWYQDYRLAEFLEGRGPLPLATVSMGWNSLPWDPMSQNRKNYWLTPSNFQSLLEYARDSIMPKLRGSAGERVVILGHWNEMGEGQFIFPCEGMAPLGQGRKGFGYLDALRRVFAKEDTPHEDLVPSEVGLGPYDLCYPREWEVGN